MADTGNKSTQATIHTPSTPFVPSTKGMDAATPSLVGVYSSAESRNFPLKVPNASLTQMVPGPCEVRKLMEGVMRLVQPDPCQACIYTVQQVMVAAIVSGYTTPLETILRVNLPCNVAWSKQAANLMPAHMQGESKVKAASIQPEDSCQKTPTGRNMRPFLGPLTGESHHVAVLRMSRQQRDGICQRHVNCFSFAALAFNSAAENALSPLRFVLPCSGPHIKLKELLHYCFLSQADILSIALQIFLPAPHPRLKLLCLNPVCSNTATLPAVAAGLSPATPQATLAATPLRATSPGSRD